MDRYIPLTIPLTIHVFTSDRPVGRWFNGECVDSIGNPIKYKMIQQGKYSSMGLCLERCNFDWPCAYNNYPGFEKKRKCYQVKACNYNKKTQECSSITVHISTRYKPINPDTNMCFVFLKNRKDQSSR